MVRVDAYGGGFESYFPASNIAAIEMPLIDLLDAAKTINAQFDADDKDHSEKKLATRRSSRKEPRRR
jgi:hypothetical protein